MTSKVESLQRASLLNPSRVSISTNKYQTVTSLLQSFVFLPHKLKDQYLVTIIERFTAKSAIVFTRTVNETQRIAILLRSLGYSGKQSLPNCWHPRSVLSTNNTPIIPPSVLSITPSFQIRNLTDPSKHHQPSPSTANSPNPPASAP